MQFSISPAPDNAITAHPDAAPADPTLAVFTSAAQLGAAIADRDPVDVWNSFAGQPGFSELKRVKKFENRAIGLARIWKAIQRLATGRNQDPQAVQARAKYALKDQAATAEQRAPRATADVKKPAGKKAKGGKRAAPAAAGKESKGDIIRRLIARKDGATINELCKATGWQAHSVRGAIATMHTKGGLEVTSSKNARGERVYQGA